MNPQTRPIPTSRRTPATHLTHLRLSLALVISLFGLTPTQSTSAATFEAKAVAIANGDGLVGYWNMDEGSGTTAADLTGNNSNLTLNPTYQNLAVEVPSLDFGSVSSLNFNGGNASTGGTLSATVQNLQTLSLSMWVNPDAISNPGVNRYLTLGNEKAGLRSAQGKLQFFMNINGWKSIQASVLQTGQYQHIAGTYDGSTMRLYRNGSEVASLSVTGTVNSSATFFYFSSGTEPFDGRLDDVRIYNRALSASEISTLYNGEECMVEATGDNVTDYMSLTSDTALENAINAAASGATLKVAGVCNNSSFAISKNLTIEGAYTVGYWTYPAGSTAVSSTLDGESANTVITVNSGITATLSRLTIANGSALAGAGISNTGTLTVNNSTFSNNKGLTSGDSKGGGIFNTGTLTVNNSTFTGNTAKLGGAAIYTDQGDTATVNNSTFTSNSSTTYGGGIMNYYGNLTVTGSTFTSNSGYYGGAIAGYYGAATTVSNSNFNTNSASKAGGGIYLHESPASVSGSTFTSNTAPEDGGGLYSSNSTTTISNGTFTSNSAKWGGGLSNAGGNVTITGSTFTNNSATQQGGGIYNWYQMTITSSTLSSNSAPYGGGIANNDDNDMTTISDSTINNNTATVKGGEFYGFPADFDNVDFGGDKMSIP